MSFANWSERHRLNQRQFARKLVARGRRKFFLQMWSGYSSLSFVFWNVWFLYVDRDQDVHLRGQLLTVWLLFVLGACIALGFWFTTKFWRTLEKLATRWEN